METLDAAGMQMPKLGLGTGQLRGAAGQAAIEQALGLGYRHLDTATMYTNEAVVGAAVAASGLPRDAIHITTKLLPEHHATADVRRAMEASLAALRTDHVELYLIHWPSATVPLADTLAAMVRLKEEGLARAIGVSNFPSRLLREAVDVIGAPIACNQVEYHVLLDQSAILRTARARNVIVTAYAPLARGAFHTLPAMQAIARKHGASTAQIGLAWLLEQPGVAAIPRAGRLETQRENLAALDIRLDDADRAAIAHLQKDGRVVVVDFAPEWDGPESAGPE